MNVTWINVTRALICQSCIEAFADQSAGVMVQKEACVIHEYFINGQSLWMNQHILIKSLTCSMWRTTICKKTQLVRALPCVRLVNEANVTENCWSIPIRIKQQTYKWIRQPSIFHRSNYITSSSEIRTYCSKLSLLNISTVPSRTLST